MSLFPNPKCPLKLSCGCECSLFGGKRVIDMFCFPLCLGEDEEENNVIVLSYPQYCRYRSMLKRIQDKPSSILTDQFALALGGIAVVSRNPQILYCRDTFDHPTLIENESVCDEFGKCLVFYSVRNVFA